MTQPSRCGSIVSSDSHIPGTRVDRGETPMAKRNKPVRGKQRQVQVLDRSQLSIRREADYIVKRAQINDSRVVGINQLILFSTSTSDAWVLDPVDGLALCLARDGERQDYTIIETDLNFSIEWNAQYRIEGRTFIVFDESGQRRTILGYPTDEIMKLCDGAR